MFITRLISRTTIYAFTWWILTNGASESWQVGIPALLAALYVDYRLFHPKTHRRSLSGVVVYALFFLKLSIAGGMDVAWRAYHPRPSLNPAMIEYPLRLTSLAARNLFVCTVSLLPGTLSAELGERSLVVHVLDVGRPIEQELKNIEERVAAIFLQPILVGDNITRTE